MNFENNSDSNQPTIVKINPQTKVFISYGNEDASELAFELENVLRNKYNCDVWLDKIKMKDGEWEMQIEANINDSSIFISLLSPHAVRRSPSPGVCLDEISYARFKNKTIIPVMVKNCQPPLSIFRLHYIDVKVFYNDPKSAIEKILMAIEKGSFSPDGLYMDFYRKLNVDSLDGELAKNLTLHLSDFVERDWILDKIDNWLSNEPQKKVFLLTGDPGSGKSAFITFLANKFKYTSVFHFCKYDYPVSRDSRTFVLNIAGQLISQFPEYFTYLKENPQIIEESINRDPKSMFIEIIVEPLLNIPQPSDFKLFIMIDALDEAIRHRDYQFESIFKVIFNQNDALYKLPNWVKIIASTRNVPEIYTLLNQDSDSFITLNISEDLGLSKKDIENYINKSLKLEDNSGVKELNTNLIIEKSEGNFLYTKEVIRSLRNKEINVLSLGSLPISLESLYFSFFERIIENEDEFSIKYKDILSVVSASFDSIDVKTIAKSTNLEISSVQLRLQSISAYFRIEEIDNEKRYRIYHKSFFDWLTGKRKNEDYRFSVDIELGHQKIIEHFDFYDTTNYQIKFLIAHISYFKNRKIRNFEEITFLYLTNFKIIKKKNDKYGIEQLLNDYNLGIKILENKSKAETIKTIYNALLISKNNLKEYPELLESQLLGRLTKNKSETIDVFIQIIIDETLNSHALNIYPRINSLKNKTLQNIGVEHILESESKITCKIFDNINQLLIVGFEDGRVLKIELLEGDIQEIWSQELPIKFLLTTNDYQKLIIISDYELLESKPNSRVVILNLESKKSEIILFACAVKDPKISISNQKIVFFQEQIPEPYDFVNLKEDYVGDYKTNKITILDLDTFFQNNLKINGKGRIYDDFQFDLSLDDDKICIFHLTDYESVITFHDFSIDFTKIYKLSNTSVSQPRFAKDNLKVDFFSHIWLDNNYVTQLLGEFNFFNGVINFYTILNLKFSPYSLRYIKLDFKEEVSENNITLIKFDPTKHFISNLPNDFNFREILNHNVNFENIWFMPIKLGIIKINRDTKKITLIPFLGIQFREIESSICNENLIILIYPDSVGIYNFETKKSKYFYIDFEIKITDDKIIENKIKFMTEKGQIGYIDVLNGMAILLKDTLSNFYYPKYSSFEFNYFLDGEQEVLRIDSNSIKRYFYCNYSEIDNPSIKALIKKEQTVLSVSENFEVNEWCFDGVYLKTLLEKKVNQTNYYGVFINYSPDRLFFKKIMDNRIQEVYQLFSKNYYLFVSTNGKVGLFNIESTKYKEYDCFKEEIINVEFYEDLSLIFFERNKTDHIDDIFRPSEKKVFKFYDEKLIHLKEFNSYNREILTVNDNNSLIFTKNKKSFEIEKWNISNDKVYLLSKISIALLGNIAITFLNDNIWLGFSSDQMNPASVLVMNFNLQTLQWDNLNLGIINSIKYVSDELVLINHSENEETLLRLTANGFIKENASISQFNEDDIAKTKKPLESTKNNNFKVEWVDSRTIKFTSNNNSSKFRCDAEITDFIYDEESKNLIVSDSIGGMHFLIVTNP